MNCQACQAPLEHEAERCPACGEPVLSYEPSLLPRSWAQPRWLPWAASAVVAVLAASVIAYASGAAHLKHAATTAGGDSDTPVDSVGWPLTTATMPTLAQPKQVWEVNPSSFYATPGPSKENPDAFTFVTGYPRVGGKERLLLAPTWRRVSDDQAQGYDTIFTALDPRTGMKLWSRPSRRTTYAPSCGDVLLQGKIVCSPGDTTVLMLDRPGGDEHVLGTTRNPVRTLTVIPDGVVVLTATGSGKEVKAAQVVCFGQDGTQRWAYDVQGGQEIEVPILTGGKVVVPFDSGSLVLDAGSGKELTKYVNRSYGPDVAGNEWLTDWDAGKVSLVQDGKTGSTFDGYRFALNAWDRPRTNLPPMLVSDSNVMAVKVTGSNATQLWRTPGEGPGAYCGGKLFVRVKEGDSYSVSGIDPGSGKALWKVPGGTKDSSWIGCSGNDPVLESEASVVAYDAGSGQQRWRVWLTKDQSAAVPGDGLVVVGLKVIRTYRDA